MLTETIGNLIKSLPNGYDYIRNHINSLPLLPVEVTVNSSPSRRLVWLCIKAPDYTCTIAYDFPTATYKVKTLNLFTFEITSTLPEHLSCLNFS